MLTELVFCPFGLLFRVPGHSSLQRTPLTLTLKHLTNVGLVTNCRYDSVPTNCSMQSHVSAHLAIAARSSIALKMRCMAARFRHMAGALYETRCPCATLHSGVLSLCGTLHSGACQRQCDSIQHYAGAGCCLGALHRVRASLAHALTADVQRACG